MRENERESVRACVCVCVRVSVGDCIGSRKWLRHHDLLWWCWWWWQWLGHSIEVSEACLPLCHLIETSLLVDSIIHLSLCHFGSKSASPTPGRTRLESGGESKKIFCCMNRMGSASQSSCSASVRSNPAKPWTPSVTHVTRKKWWANFFRN